MKKILMAAGLVMLLTACGGGQTANQTTAATTAANSAAAETSAAEQTEAAASGEQIVLKYAAAEVPGTPEYEADLKFIEEIEQGSGGKIKIEFYHSSQLGNDKQVVMSAIGGGLDIVKSSAGNLMDYSTALAFTDLPGLFKSQPHVRASFDDQEIRDWVAEKIKSDIGMIPVNYDIDGGAARALFYNSKNGLAKVPENMSGLKLRTTGSEIEIALFDQWGAASVPMNFNELYLALQQGTVDGLYGHPIGTYGNKLCEVTDYCTIIDISYIVSVQLMSQACIDKLGGEGSELYNLVMEAGKNLEVTKDELLNAELDTILDEIAASGTEVYTPSEEELELWRATGEAIWGDYVGEGKDAPQEIVDKIMEIGNNF